MKQIYFFPLLLVLVTYSANKSQAQESELYLNSFSIDELDFDSIFAERESDDKAIYCILGNGYFRTPRSENSDSLITDWLRNHPNSIVTPVSAMGPTMLDDPDGIIVYIWITNQNENLNEFLVKEGAFPGSVMVDAKAFFELIKDDVPEQENPRIIRRFVSDEVYENFIEEIKLAEQVAYESQKGVWKQ